MRIDILKKLLDEEIRVRERSNNMQARLFGDAMQDVLSRYELRQLTSADVIARLVELAKKIRDARRRHESLGLTIEEAAFYDAVAGSTEDWEPDPEIADIARDLAVRPDTVRNYLAYLDIVFLTTTVPAWSGSLTSKITKTPKVFVTDSGLDAHLLRATADALRTPGHPLWDHRPLPGWY